MAGNPKPLFQKVLICGTKKAGKSELSKAIAISERPFSSGYDMTIGVEFASKEELIDGKRVKFQLWDVAGDPNFRDVGFRFTRGTHAAIFVVDTTQVSKDQVTNFELFLKNLDSDTPIFIVPTKWDDKTNRKIDEEGLKQFKDDIAEKRGSDRNIHLLDPCSAKESLNIPSNWQKIVAILKPDLEKQLASVQEKDSKASPVAQSPTSVTVQSKPFSSFIYDLFYEHPKKSMGITGLGLGALGWGLSYGLAFSPFGFPVLYTALIIGGAAFIGTLVFGAILFNEEPNESIKNTGEATESISDDEAEVGNSATKVAKKMPKPLATHSGQRDVQLSSSGSSAGPGPFDPPKKTRQDTPASTSSSQAGHNPPSRQG